MVYNFWHLEWNYPDRLSAYTQARVCLWTSSFYTPKSKSRDYIMSAAGSLSLKFSMRRSSEQKCNLLQECLKSCTSQPPAELLLGFCAVDVCTSWMFLRRRTKTIKILFNSQWVCVRFLAIYSVYFLVFVSAKNDVIYSWELSWGNGESQSRREESRREGRRERGKEGWRREEGSVVDHTPGLWSISHQCEQPCWTCLPFTSAEPGKFSSILLSEHSRPS